MMKTKCYHFKTLESNGYVLDLCRHHQMNVSLILLQCSRSLAWFNGHVSYRKVGPGCSVAPSDVLFVDMPPGTGDTQLSFAQSVEVDGAIIVTTPQQVAIQDAIKGVEMFRKTNVPIIGCILNMSSYICNSCGEETKLKSNIHRLTDDNSIELLGDLPLDLNVSNACDEGHPIVLDSEKHVQGRKFETIVRKINDKLF
ncbi:Iron-sulfur protein NUBPL [Orchesella cincta]|uniref:Iron-sulfur protein NUBPL n=1 Tax=Orchesella cincta TaxID=48709 RepID=A0A1D2NMG6_ORCCI|nr:Iron-sulfur protein NUBPL [Orchesella cincta]